MYWLIVISRRQGGLCIISSPDCIFIVHVKKEKIHVCTLHYWTFCGSGWSTQWTNTVVLSLICAVKDVFSFLVYFHDSSALVRAAYKHFCDWLISEKKLWSFGVLKITLRQKQSCLHSSSFADPLVCSNLALHFKDFFFFFQSIKDQKPCQSKADHLNFLPSSKSLNMRQNYLLNYTLWV